MMKGINLLRSFLAGMLVFAVVCGLFIGIPEKAHAEEANAAKDYKAFVSEVANLMMSEKMETREGMVELICLVESDIGIALAEALYKDVYKYNDTLYDEHIATFYFDDFTVAIKAKKWGTAQLVTTNPNLQGHVIEEIYVFTGDPYAYSEGGEPVYRKVAFLGQIGYGGKIGNQEIYLPYQFCAADYIESEEYPYGSPKGNILYHHQRYSYRINQPNDAYDMIIGTTEGDKTKNTGFLRVIIEGTGTLNAKINVTNYEGYNIPSMQLLRKAIGPDVLFEDASNWAANAVHTMKDILPESMSRNFQDPVSRGDFAQFIINFLEWKAAF